LLVVVVLPDPFRRMGAWRNSTETQQSSHAPRSGPEVKNGSGAEEARMQDSQGGGESDPAEGVRVRCMKNSTFLSCIGKRTKEGCDRGSEVETFNSGQDGEGPVPPRNRRNLAGEGAVRKSSFPQRAASVSNIYNSRSQGQGTWATGSAAPAAVSESTRSFP